MGCLLELLGTVTEPLLGHSLAGWSGQPREGTRVWKEAATSLAQARSV